MSPVRIALLVALAIVVIGGLVWVGIRDQRRKDAERIIKAEKNRMNELSRRFPGMGVGKDDPIFGRWID